MVILFFHISFLLKTFKFYIYLLKCSPVFRFIFNGDTVIHYHVGLHHLSVCFFQRLSRLSVQIQRY